MKMTTTLPEENNRDFMNGIKAIGENGKQTPECD
jgi:hypothetical protein